MRQLLLLLLLAACASRPPDPGPPQDEVLQRAAEAAQGALELDQPEAAARLYARALSRARERDDAAAIDAMGFGQATAALAAGDAAGALAVAQEVRDGLARRGRGASAGLLLAEATARFRLGQLDEAARLSRFVTARREAPEAARRAWFLLGLVAGARGDLAGVAAARDALGEPAEPAFRADAVELEAVAGLLRNDAGFAAARAETAAALRQAAIDYRGLSRALALQGAALARLGDRDRAADLLLRAGRSAAERGEAPDARLWLAEAARLGAGRADLEAAIRQVRLDPSER
jgi:hypothetical protein